MQEELIEILATLTCQPDEARGADILHSDILKGVLQENETQLELALEEGFQRLIAHGLVRSHPDGEFPASV